jgi:hypothetical protein
MNFDRTSDNPFSELIDDAHSPCLRASVAAFDGPYLML